MQKKKRRLSNPLRKRVLVVRSAQPLSIAQQDRIRQHLLPFIPAGKTFEDLRFIVDPLLIGGLVYQIDDLLVDASLSGKLGQVKSHLYRTLSL
jgi:F0F1-type ATP synthase delta subunit